MSSFDVDQMKKMFQVTVTDEAEGRKRMGRGKASAMVVIPEGFTLDLLDAKPVTLLVVKNPSEQFLPDVVEEFMNTMAVMLSGAIQAFSEEVKGIRAMLDLKLDAIPWETLGPEFGKAQKKVVAASKYLNPLLIGLREEETKTAGARPQTTASDLFSAILPGMAIMFLLFIVQTLMRDILSDREDGKLRRMMTTPLRPLELIGARLAGGWVMGLIVLLVMVAFGTARLPRRLGRPRLFPAARGRGLLLDGGLLRPLPRPRPQPQPGRSHRRAHHPGLQPVRRVHDGSGGHAESVQGGRHRDPQPLVHRRGGPHPRGPLPGR